VTSTHAILLFLAALAAGALNSVAGGGSFLSFPALMFAGIAPKIANATNTVALWPGTVASVWAYRRELTARKRELISLGMVSLLGGVMGAVLLLKTPERTFVQILPFLLLAATLLFAFGSRISRAVRERIGHNEHQTTAYLIGVTIIQLLIATYGGYFGGGIGILMLAALALMGMEEIHAMNSLKTILASLINGVAVVTFIVARAVVWPEATLMIVGAILGGYGGAHYSQKMPPILVRRFVIAVGITMTGYFFVRPYFTI
jgi:uncharacterized membrane protein YfcA